MIFSLGATNGRRHRGKDKGFSTAALQESKYSVIEFDAIYSFFWLLLWMNVYDRSGWEVGGLKKPGPAALH